jgi:hypothetical protein
VAVLLLCATALGYAQTTARNFIWKASARQGGVVYLVGSVHLLTKSYYPLNPAFELAFKQSDLLVEEVDLGEMMAPESQLQLLTRGMLPASQTLDRVVSAETFSGVSRRLGELGLPVEPLKRFKPWALALTLEAMEWQKAGFDADLGLDKHFYDLARTQGKQVQGLETLAFQISRFDGMSNDLQDRLLAQTLKELERTKAAFTAIADAWKAGDTATIEQLVLQDLKAEPQMYDRLLVERNRTWLPMIEALFSRPRPAFVVVGAAHLVGPDGLLRMLASRGYEVAQM